MPSSIALATLERDGWALESGEGRHAAYPDSFDIPSLHDRQNVRVGQGVKLIFQIQIGEDNGEDEIAVERMWATVAEHHEDFYVGILDNQPAGIQVGQGFDRGLEFAFRAEHIIDIADPPRDWLVKTHGRRLGLSDAG